MEEVTILESTDKTIRLTNKHIRREGKRGGSSAYAALPLEHVSGVLFSTRSFPLLAAIGAIILIVAAVAGLGAPDRAGAAIPLAVAGIVCLIAYFLTQKGMVEIVAAGGAKVSFAAATLSHDQIKTFAEAVLAQAEAARKAKA